MAYKINNKFVSKATYEEHVASLTAHENGSTIVTETTETTETKPRNVSPRVAAFRRLAKAEKTLKRSQAFWGKERKTEVPPPVDQAQAEYDAAAEAVKDLI